MAGAPPSNSNFPAIVELNVGGVFYSTSISTLTSEPGSKLAKTFGSEASPETVLKDSKVSKLCSNVSQMVLYTLYSIHYFGKCNHYNENSFSMQYYITVWKIRKFTLTHFQQKFRESIVSTKEVTKELISRNIFSISEFLVFPHCVHYAFLLHD